MDFKHASQLISSNYVAQAESAQHSRTKALQSLLTQRRLPDEGWDEISIQQFMYEIAAMDSNNFSGNVGAGEREARLVNPLVKNRYWNLGHGVGRSGELSAEQPKAAGSSLLAKLTEYLALNAFKLAGFNQVSKLLILPLATGMGLSMCLLALRQQNPLAKYVIWSRIDQKTCLKCIYTAGFEADVIELLVQDDSLVTDVDAIEKQILQREASSIACVLCTTSCFAPRTPDNVVEVAKLCKKYQVPFLINNAYGVQASKCVHLVNEAIRVGRVDAFVQSTDKNFLVPVGGSIVASNDTTFIAAVNKLYPGRASVNAVLDLFLTLMMQGRTGWETALQQRKDNYEFMRAELDKLATRLGERLLKTPSNPISFAMTLHQLPQEHVSMLGSMLFTRRVSGARVVSGLEKKEICGIAFAPYGGHSATYPSLPYINLACAIGTSREEIVTSLARLESCYSELKHKTSAS